MQTKESEGKEVSACEAKRLSGSLPVDEKRETMLGCTAVANIIHRGSDGLVVSGGLVVVAVANQVEVAAPACSVRAVLAGLQ